MNAIQEYKKLLRELETVKKEEARLEGQVTTLVSMLHKQHDVSSIHEAEDLHLQLQSELDGLEREYVEELNQFKNNWSTTLAELEESSKPSSAKKSSSRRNRNRPGR